MNNEIDWSTAPEWADRVVVGSTSKTHYWANKDTRKSFVDLYIYYSDTHIREGWKVAEWRPDFAAAWNGEGLPPIGKVCNVLMDPSGNYAEVFVVAHDEGEAVYRFTSGPNQGVYKAAEQKMYYGFWIFRTPEQIVAEEKRETEIKNLIETITPVYRESARIMAVELYERGYRKLNSPK